jgi:histidinol-phosphate aminotransferase
MTEPVLAELLRPELAELRAYLPDQGQYAVRLDANEAPPLLSQEARDRLARAAAELAWERYPDATVAELRQAVATRCEASADEVVVGVGSDEIITLLLTVLSLPRGRAPAATVVTTTPTFVMYRLSARVRGMRVVEVPLDEQWDLPAESILHAIEMAAPNLVFIASPNNPTGNLMSRDRLEQVIAGASGSLVVIDEAYIDYAPRSQLELCRAHPNVVILRTLSKVGFAALRVGWLLGRPELVTELNKARLPYNLPVPSQVLATLALSELSEEIESTARFVIAERARLAAELETFDGVHVSRSDANFLWLRTGQPAGDVFTGLAKRGILVRSFHSSGGRLGHQLRVTVGTREENTAFLTALREVLAA